MRILLTGGGSGGHITPLIAVENELKSFTHNQPLEFFYIGSAGIYSQFLEENGIKVITILESKWRRYFDINNFLDIVIKFPLSLLQAFWHVFWIMPDVCFSKGGPGSLSVILACVFYRVPILIHESDSVPGFVNRFTSRYAQGIALSFSQAQDFFENKKIIFSGTPIRSSLLQNIPDKLSALQSFGFASNKPLLLILGGSQGAERINDFFLEISINLIKDYYVLHQVGNSHFANCQIELKALGRKNLIIEIDKFYKIVSFLDQKNLKNAYAAADLVISRAGSATIFEIAAFGKPSILVPLPEAAGNHQVKNAYAYAKTGAALVIEHDNLRPNIFLNELKKIFSQAGLLQLMSEAAKSFAKPNASQELAQLIVHLGSGMRL
jgi:UDP-N-acetylglucosamine--N-acetylmuramyl-(pentapeptide) pyrophosphoryl-undecaprenol N-acetylglucosamine transferase